MRKIIITLFLFVGLVQGMYAQVFDQDQIYDSGDMMIRIGVGPLFPLYVHAFDFSDFSMSSMAIGWSVGIGFDYYLTNNIKLGAGASFGSSRSVNRSYSFLVPVTFRVDWEFHALRFDFPVGVDIGMLFNKYRELFAINFLVRPHVGAYYNITRSWSVGVDALFWVVPQVVWDDLSKSRVGTFAEVVVAGRYRF